MEVEFLPLAGFKTIFVGSYGYYSVAILGVHAAERQAMLLTL